MVLPGAYALAVLGFGASFLARDDLVLQTAVGEPFEGAPGQFVSRAAPRPLSGAAAGAPYVVEEVSPAIDASGRIRSLSARVRVGGDVREVTRFRPLRLGWSAFLWPTAFGYAPYYELVDESGKVLDSAFVKLDLLPPGKTDYVRLEAAPYRAFVRIPAGAALEGGDAGLRSLPMSVAVYRGKLPVADAVVRPGGAIAFEGAVLRFPAIRYSVRLRLLRDPGVPLVLGALALAVAGGASRILRARRAAAAASVAS
jgi:hypothetical protein